MLRPSRYNFIWTVGETNRAVLFNCLNGASMEINKTHLDLLNESNEFDIDKLPEEKTKIATELKKNGFLINDFVDELSILKFRNASARYNKNIFTLTIIPTYACNLECFYCFEERASSKIMPHEVQDAIVEYALKNSKGTNNMNVCWFGGEPLMAWNVIVDLSERLIQAAMQNKSEYAATMVTNGYLLDDEKINSLEKLKIKKIQITVDGPPELHSKRKGMKGDANENFRKLLDIFEKLLEKDIKLSIRVNIDKTNFEALDELMDILGKHPAHKANIYPAQITPYTEICKNVKNTCFDTAEFAEIEVEFYKLLVQKGLKTDLSLAYPKPIMNFCGADQINSFTIEPDGNVYKCWNDIGNRDNAVFNLLKDYQNETELEMMKMRHIKWLTWDPFEFAECLECKVLPLCMGGCPYKYKVMNNNTADCMTIKRNLEKMVMNNYYCMKMKSILRNDEDINSRIFSE